MPWYFEGISVITGEAALKVTFYSYSRVLAWRVRVDMANERANGDYLLLH